MSENVPPILPEGDSGLPAECAAGRAGHVRPLANPRRLRLHARPERHMHLPPVS